jgi:hypothetical protein
MYTYIYKYKTLVNSIKVKLEKEWETTASIQNSHKLGSLKQPRITILQF